MLCVISINDNANNGIIVPRNRARHEKKFKKMSEILSTTNRA